MSHRKGIMPQQQTRVPVPIVAFSFLVSFAVVYYFLLLVAPEGAKDAEHVAESVATPRYTDTKTEQTLRARRDARRGLPWSSAGPRQPSNDWEARVAEIPEYRAEEDLIFYSHIHKTSGTSLSCMLGEMFRRNAVVPTSHPSMGLKMDAVTGHDDSWWQQYQVMFSHNRPNVTDELGIPENKKVRLLVTVRNPLLHKASIYYESVCRFGRHINNGTIDTNAATDERVHTPGGRMFEFCRRPSLWVGSPQFNAIYRNMQSNWLSYGAAKRHMCIEPNLEKNEWRSGRGAPATCAALHRRGDHKEIWDEYFERTADAAIQRLETALWVGVTERMEESTCLLFYTLKMRRAKMGAHRIKEPRPITVWDNVSMAMENHIDKADWRVFDAANDILDVRLWKARQELEFADAAERQRLGRCYGILTGKASPDDDLLIQEARKSMSSLQGRGV